MIKTLNIITILFMIIFVFSSSVYSQPTWTNAGGDNIASNPANWSGGIEPQTGDIAVSDGTSTDDCTWDYIVTLDSLSISPDYTGTLTIDSDLSTTGDVDMFGGNTILGSGNLIIGATIPSKRPSVKTDPPDNIDGYPTIFNATVNPNWSETTVKFFWGSSNVEEHITSEQAIGGGTVDIPVSAEVGLRPLTKYSYKVWANNALGTMIGGIVTFMTGSDLDGDGVSDHIDNCPTIPNVEQYDDNSDDIGDACTVIHCIANSGQLQDVLAIAESNNMFDIIQLVQGTYGISANNDSSFIYDTSDDNGVEVYGISIEGGYTGGCASREMDAQNTILNGEDYQMPPGSHGVIAITSSSDQLLASSINIEGVTVQGGNALAEGGGIYIHTESGDINITNSIIKENTAFMICDCGVGGGIYAVSNKGTVSLTNNEISDNTSDYDGNYGIHLGGGIYASSSESQTTLIENVITGNYAHGKGGGVGIQGRTILDKNIISYNTAGSPGGLYIYTYGTDDIILSSNIVSHNTANTWYKSGNDYYSLGGGIYIHSNSANLVITNNIIHGNSNNTGEYDSGGGLNIKSKQNVYLINNTITENYGGAGDGLYLDLYNNSSQLAQIYNNIIWGNGEWPSDPNGDIYLKGPGTFNFYNNNFDLSKMGNNGSPTIYEENHFNVDPLFVDVTTNNYQLSENSPLIDQGNNEAPYLPDNDFEEDSRISEGVVDIGADEYLSVSSISVSPLYHNFGNVGTGNFSNDILITNNGKRKLFIDSITSPSAPSTPFSIIADNCTGQRLSSSETCSLTVQFNPLTEGTFLDTFTITSSDRDNPVVIVTIAGKAITTLKGKVTDSDTGFPLDDVLIVITDADNLYMKWTDIDGLYSVSGLTAGDLSVRLTRSGYEEYTDNIPISPGQVKTFDVEMTREVVVTKGGIVGNVIDLSTGDPLEGANVYVVDAQGIEWTTDTDNNGNYNLDNIAQGDITGSIIKTGYIAYDLPEDPPYTVLPGQTLTIDASLVRIPVISNIEVTESSDSATITWITDQPSDSLVEYGVTTSYEYSVSDPAMTTSHSVTLTELNPGAIYHFSVTSTNTYGFSSSSDDNTFTTMGPITLTITSPLENDTINRADVIVKGTVANSTGNETGVAVNGIAAVVYNGEFFVNHVPLQDGEYTITANAVDTAGNTDSHSILVNADTTVPHVTLRANIESGIAPLTTYFSVSTSISNSEVTYDFYHDENEVIDSTGDTFDDISFEYITEGVYYPNITVTDDQGITYTDSIAIAVLNRNDLDALLQTKWNVMKTALGIGDISGAIVNFDSNARDAYTDQFTDLSPVLADIANEMNTAQMNIVSIEDDIAEYEILVIREGTTFSLQLKFVKDSNGLWKIWGF
jgi:hypothetical protein